MISRARSGVRTENTEKQREHRHREHQFLPVTWPEVTRIDIFTWCAEPIDARCAKFGSVIVPQSTKMRVGVKINSSDNASLHTSKTRSNHPIPSHHSGSCPDLTACRPGLGFLRRVGEWSGVLTSALSASPLSAASLAVAASPALADHLLLHHVDHLVRDPQVLDGRAAHIALGHPPELVTVLCAHGRQTGRQ